ncbi:MAG: hypothetical protein JNN20_07385 [Betaproteobacteria bacterium]|nr:hypothetical protein [Betaproteobacteria bacterium]
MNAIEVLLLMTVPCGIGIALFATYRVVREKEGFGRTTAQLAFTWLLPFLGPMVVLHVLRKEPERGSGQYASSESPLNDGAHINQRDATID